MVDTRRTWRTGTVNSCCAADARPRLVVARPQTSVLLRPAINDRSHQDDDRGQSGRERRSPYSTRQTGDHCGRPNAPPREVLLHISSLAVWGRRTMVVNTARMARSWPSRSAILAPPLCNTKIRSHFLAVTVVCRQRLVGSEKRSQQVTTVHSSSQQRWRRVAKERSDLGKAHSMSQRAVTVL